MARLDRVRPLQSMPSQNTLSTTFLPFLNRKILEVNFTCPCSRFTVESASICLIIKRSFRSLRIRIIKFKFSVWRKSRRFHRMRFKKSLNMGMELGRPIKLLQMTRHLDHTPSVKLLLKTKVKFRVNSCWSTLQVLRSSL